MAYQQGTVGPIAYTQDNSGVADDTTTPISYTPQAFGAPETAKIIAGTVNQSYLVERGFAYVQDVNIQPDSITFKVFTQAAGGGIIGHHSGRIIVTTSFTWYTD